MHQINKSFPNENCLFLTSRYFIYKIEYLRFLFNFTFYVRKTINLLFTILAILFKFPWNFSPILRESPLRLLETFKVLVFD